MLPNGNEEIYLLLPMFRRGSLQDYVLKNADTGIAEDEVLHFFLGLCNGLLQLHTHGTRKAPATFCAVSHVHVSYTLWSGMCSYDDVLTASFSLSSIDARPFLPSYYNITKPTLRTNVLRYSRTLTLTPTDPPWAHRDVKPGNVLLSTDGTPVLMDFGSVQRARVEIATRTAALDLQDQASQHSSMQVGERVGG